MRILSLLWIPVAVTTGAFLLRPVLAKRFPAVSLADTDRPSLELRDYGNDIDD